MIGDFAQDRRCLLGLELIGDGPARALGRHAEGLLLAQAVHLKHYAVGGHGQALALGVPIVDVVEYLVERRRLAHVVADLEAPGARRLHILVMSFGRQLVAKEVVEIGVELTCCHHGRLLALERAAGGVARVGKEGLLGGFALAVEGLERCPRHQHLATDLELAGPRRHGLGGRRSKEVGLPVGSHGGHCRARLQLEGYGADGADVGRHVVALHAVAARDGAHEAPVLVVERDAQAVELQLAANLKRLAAQALADALVELAHLILVVGVGEREHRPLVSHGNELLREVAANALSGRIGVVELGVALLQVLQLAQQGVELLVGDGRSIQHVIVVVVAVQLGAQLHYAFLLSHKAKIFVQR